MEHYFCCINRSILVTAIKCIYKIYFREEQLRQDQEREEIRQLEIERLKQIQVSFFSLKNCFFLLENFLSID